MTTIVDDQRHMIRALELARLGLNSATPNPRVGCVIVGTNGEVVGEGYHRKAGEPHAEINALADAGEKAKGAVVYVTLEPCSHFGKTGPCADALIAAEVAEVVYAMEDPNPSVSGNGFMKLEEAGITVRGPVLIDDAYTLNPGFIKRMKTGLPFVRIKSAMSLDGRTAMASGESKWVTGPKAREDVQKFRARSCCIITGVESVISDDPALTVRIDGEDRQPLRVIMDTHGRCPRDAEIMQQPGHTVIAHGKTVEIVDKNPEWEYWPVAERDGRVDPYALLRKLAQEGCNEVLVETGATLAGSFVRRGMVDELVVYMAAKLMGSQARPLFDLPVQTMSGLLPLKIKDIVAVGEDWRITAIPDPDS